ncbi:MAG: endonuclease/exonuclease/phosphatase family protein [Bacteroidota bacterium]
MSTIETLLFYAALCMIISSLIPLIRNDHWTFRVFEYPRLQKLALSCFLLTAGLVFSQSSNVLFRLTLIGLSVNITYLMFLVLPFTIFGGRPLKSTLSRDAKRSVRLLIANVYQENKKCDLYLNLISTRNPDIILLIETDPWWKDRMDKLLDCYPYSITAPLDNTYGMLMYSRLPLSDQKVRYLIEPDIPSIKTKVRLECGQLVTLYCVHPQPPVPQENPRSTERDAELLLIAKEASAETDPVIVAGDLNDVAWSYTTKLFSKVSGLLDPRRGRGFFNSFHAKHFFLRFPLDHIFCSSDFTLSSLKRLPACGSDHFPVLAELQYSTNAPDVNDPPVASEEDMRLADKKINAVD